VDPLYASGGFYTEPPTHTANAHPVNPESSRNHLYTPSQVSPQGYANTPPREPPVVLPTGRIHPNLPNYPPTSTPAVETRTRPTYLGPTPSALPRTPPNPSPSAQAVVLDRAPHTYPVVHRTGGFSQRWHPYASTPTQAANIRGTPASVDLSSPAFFRTPTNAEPSTQALVLHRPPHTNPPQRVSQVVSATANSHRTGHPYASTFTPAPAPAANARTTPTSVQSSSPSLPRTPVDASFLSAQALAHLGAPQTTPSGAEIFYRPIPNQARFEPCVRVNAPGQPDGYVPLNFLWQAMPSTHNQPTTRNQPTTPTHPPTTYPAQSTPTSASSKASSPPQSATALEFRKKAREYRTLSDTLHASGNNKGAADALAKANTEDGNAIRLERRTANNAKRRAAMSAEETEEYFVNRRATEAKSRAAKKLKESLKPAENVSEQRTPSSRGQERPEEAGGLPFDSASPDEHEAEESASEQARSSSPADMPTPVSTRTPLSSREFTIFGLLKKARELRGTAVTLQLSGDTDGPANSIAEAEVEEGKARELIRTDETEKGLRAEKRAREGNASNTGKRPITALEHHDHRVLRMLSAALNLRDAASELRSSGDVDGAAKAIGEAEFEETQASRLIDRRAARRARQAGRR
jgi:hypothetical protein